MLAKEGVITVPNIGIFIITDASRSMLRFIETAPLRLVENQPIYYLCTLDELKDNKDLPFQCYSETTWSHTTIMLFNFSSESDIIIL